MSRQPKIEALLMTSDNFGGDGDEDFEINEDDDVNVYYVEVFVCLFLKFYPHVTKFHYFLKGLSVTKN